MRPLATILLAAAAAAAAAATAGRAHADDALDEGLDEPIPDSSSEPPGPRGSDDTYGRYTDLRFRVTSGSGSWGAEIRPEAYGDVEDYRDGHMTGELSFRLDLVHSFGLRPGGGWYFGTGLEHARADGTLMTADTHRNIYAWHLLGGWARPLGSKLQLEIGVVSTLGIASLRDSFAGAVTPTISGYHAAIGAETSLVYIDPSGWLLAVTAGARYVEELMSDPNGYQVALDGPSTALGAFLGKRY